LPRSLFFYSCVQWVHLENDRHVRLDTVEAHDATLS
jgi:hypothetical protein